jgi:glycosyltransferase involved in cell wall biosynthesis
MPRVWQREPRTRLAIVGADPPAALRKAVAPAADRITITDYVDDIRPHLNRARIAVAPLPYGVGIQNKVLEAMATATPVVASPTACFALPVSDGEEVLVGDGAGPFADRVLELLASPELCDRIGRAGRRYVEKNHSWQEATGRLETLYQQEVEPEAEDR